MFPILDTNICISFTIHYAWYNEKSVVWLTLISSLFCRVGPKFLQSWLPWSSQCQIQISSTLCCCLLRNNYFIYSAQRPKKYGWDIFVLLHYVLLRFVLPLFLIYWLEIEKSQYSPHLCMSTDYKGSEPDVLVHILKVSEISYLFVFRWFQISELIVFYYQERLNLIGYFNNLWTIFKKMNKVSIGELFCLYKQFGRQQIHFYQDGRI